MEYYQVMLQFHAIIMQMKENVFPSEMIVTINVTLRIDTKVNMNIVFPWINQLKNMKMN